MSETQVIVTVKGGYPKTKTEKRIGSIAGKYEGTRLSVSQPQIEIIFTFSFPTESCALDFVEEVKTLQMVKSVSLPAEEIDEVELEADKIEFDDDDDDDDDFLD